MMKKKKVTIIGAGLGGLTAALKLVKDGYDVHVFEKNDSVGGKAGSLKKNGFRFDTGPTLITMPFVLREILGDDTLLEKVAPLDNTCTYFFPDKTVIQQWANINDFSHEIEHNSDDSSETVKNYFAYTKKIYDLTSDLFLYTAFQKLRTVFTKQSLETMIQLRSIDPFRTMHQANSSYFRDEKLIQLFDRFATYNGSNPFKTPATLNIIPYVEMAFGGHYLPGGVYAIANRLYERATDAGATFSFGSEVEDILLEDKTVQGVQIKEERFESDIVISNADVHFTYKNLLKDTNSKSAKRYGKLEPSSSALVFYWGIEGDHKNLNSHNILFSENYEREFRQLFDEGIYPDDPTVYIFISSKIHPEDAPKGHENWFVMINAPYITDKNRRMDIAKIRKHIVSKINKTLNITIEPKIISEETATPVTIERQTNSMFGSLYGISSNTQFAAFLRQKNKSSDYKNLYFCGGSAHPGGGVPLVMLSGKITAELINEE